MSFFLSVLVTIGALLFLARKVPIEEMGRELVKKNMGSLVLKSSVFENNGDIPLKYTCDGIDKNPPLEILGAPEGAKSLVLIMDDPDASNGMWDHWVVFNIDPTVRVIEEGEEPKGAPGKNTWGKTGYGGPCPGKGKHRYFFKLYALDVSLDLTDGATKKDIETAMERRVIDKTELIGLYERRR